MQCFFINKHTREEASEFAARIFEAAFWNGSGNVLVGTATGQTPVLTYKNMQRIFNEEYDGYEEEFEECIRFMQLDNYVSDDATAENLPEYSYQRELEESIWKIPHNAHFIPREYIDPEEECKHYEKVVEEQRNWADLYIQLLGIGDKDGHIGFNMPGTPLDAGVHIATLNEETIEANAKKFFNGDTSKVPKKAITMGIGNILQADVIVLEAFGSEKAEIIHKSFFEDMTEEVPASALRTYDGLLFVILDDESSSAIREKEGDDVFTNLDKYDVNQIILDNN